MRSVTICMAIGVESVLYGPFRVLKPCAVMAGTETRPACCRLLSSYLPVERLVGASEDGQL